MEVVVTIHKVVIFSALATVHKLTHFASDVAMPIPQILFTSILEMDLVIICASIPIIYPMLARYLLPRPGILTLSSRIGRVFESSKNREV